MLLVAQVSSDRIHSVISAILRLAVAMLSMVALHKVILAARGHTQSPAETEHPEGGEAGESPEDRVHFASHLNRGGDQHHLPPDTDLV